MMLMFYQKAAAINAPESMQVLVISIANCDPAYAFTILILYGELHGY